MAVGAQGIFLIQDGELRQAVDDLEAYISGYGRASERAVVPDAKETLASGEPLAEPPSLDEDDR
jgi:hypothetical protein